MLRNILCFALTVIFLFILMPLVDAALIAHWPMDEGSGKEIEDVAGKGGIGKFVGNPTWVEGKFGKALEFGSGNSVTVPSNADLQPTSITVTLWVYFNDVSPPRQDFFSKSDDYALSLHEWADDGTIWPIITSGGDWIVVGGKTKIEAERWYHAALVYDEKSKKLTSYVDAELDANIDAPAGLENRIGGPLTLGTYSDRFLKGLLDEVKIWNEALPDNRIKEDMVGGTAVNTYSKLTITWGKLKSF